MQAVAAKVADGNVLRLVQKFLTSGVMENGVFKPTTIGTPQGGVISPLLANIVLDSLDWQLHYASYRFVRYADDFIVLCQFEQQAKEALILVQLVLENLQLQLNSEKTSITRYTKGYSFLGFILSSRSRRIRPKSLKKFKDKVRQLTHRKHNFDASAVKTLNRVIRGTAQYFAMPTFFTGRETLHKLDSWIRMRLRCMITKRMSSRDNSKLRDKYFRKLGLLSLQSFCHY
jgi:group II intron reverse transcriptase/maturase